MCSFQYEVLFWQSACQQGYVHERCIGDSKLRKFDQATQHPACGETYATLRALGPQDVWGVHSMPGGPTACLGGPWQTCVASVRSLSNNA